MFEELPSPGRKNWRRALLLSSGAHIALLLMLVRSPAPLFMSPSEVDLGVPHSSGSVSITYLAPRGAEQQTSSATDRRLTLHAASVPKPKPRPAERKRQEPPTLTADNAPDQTARGGSLFGQRTPGSPLTGDEVVPGFPVVFPDPPVPRSELPAGVQGDVIVQVTIDAEGNVTQTTLLHGIGYGIEQKVLETVQHWRFHPAMRNGVTIASQHLVYFHYPS